ncbi:MAG: DNA-directed RNA polymerase subunit omega [Clostridiaceae bacterium]|jgi:DNA-directed RNA polymerase subunit omega|nr:DNA-directed RNA polymerase subunit omega [Clostridiaceae bacterium]
MIYPPMSKLLETVDSRYTLVIVVAKRARMLTDGAPKLTDYDSEKDVTIAINEVAEKSFSYHRIKKAQLSHDNLVEGSLNSIEDAVL